MNKPPSIFKRWRIVFKAPSSFKKKMQDEVLSPPSPKKTPE
jgi:hypothetical protein